MTPQQDVIGSQSFLPALPKSGEIVHQSRSRTGTAAHGDMRILGEIFDLACCFLFLFVSFSEYTLGPVDAFGLLGT
jgi:hypothetical protein